jgi:IS30 family transposase
LYHAQK